VPHCLLVKFVSVLILAVLNNHRHVKLLVSDRREHHVNFFAHFGQLKQNTVLAARKSSESLKYPLSFLTELVFRGIETGGLNSDLNSLRDISLRNLIVEFAREGVIDLIGIEDLFESLLTSLNTGSVGFDHGLIIIVTKDILGLSQAFRVNARYDRAFVSIASLLFVRCGLSSVDLHFLVLLKISFNSSLSGCSKLFFD